MLRFFASNVPFIIGGLDNAWVLGSRTKGIEPPLCLS
jgi:hypothetical protein